VLLPAAAAIIVVIVIGPRVLGRRGLPDWMR
jgi:hypothetical protein